VSVDITFLARGVHEFSYARYELANVTVIFDRPNVLTEHSYSKQGFIIFIINENKSNPPSWTLGNRGVNHISLPVCQAEESHDTRFGQYQHSMAVSHGWKCLRVDQQTCKLVMYNAIIQTI